MSLASSVGAILPDDLNYVGQVGKVETGRPDVVGSDSSGLERLLIEAKFAAQLTAQQPLGYLARLPTDRAGLLLVVVPSVRMSSLWVELLSALPDTLGCRAPSPSADLDLPVAKVAVGDHRVLAIVSWRHLVTAVLDALRHGGETALAQDAEQLLALTEVMDNSAYAPVRPGDYGARSARQIQQLQLLIDDAHTAAMQGTVLVKAGTSSHGRIFYGWYLESTAAQKWFWFGFSPRLWDRYGTSPLWMRVPVDESWTHQRLAHALAALDLPGAPGLFDEGTAFLIPLAIPHYASQNESVASLVVQLEVVAGALNAAVPSEVTPSVNAADQTELDGELSAADEPI